MPQQDYDVRSAMLELLIGKVAEDRYPSATMLDMIEQLLTPDELPVYAEMMLDKLRSERYPSIPLMLRVMALG